MDSPLYLTNSLTRKKELFEPLNPPFVGLYVCGPTVYGEPHLGHARSAITFDLVARYLRHKGYQVRYVRNITDVGHLVNDADEGEDKIGRLARLQQLEPMEVVQKYTLKYHEGMDKLNNLPPSIEPCASGHIQEQIKLIEQILEHGFAYVSNGSVYFDVLKYDGQHRYGELSGRIIEELQAGERELDGQDEKRNKADFALWKQASPEHIMRWDSPWGEGFPGWHIECSAMSKKYLGEVFDIHGGGMDLLFPHHESEIAQSVAATGKEPVKYWLHCNMITLNGQKMGKSLGNAINLNEFFTGDHVLLDKAYSPMTIRYFMLTAHYRSTLDFSNEALTSAERAFRRLMNTYQTLKGLKYVANPSQFHPERDKEILAACANCTACMDDDLNTATTLANLFELSSTINAMKDGLIPVGALSQQAFDALQHTFKVFIEDIFGLKDEAADDSGITDGLMQLVINIRKSVREKKDYATSDQIRDELAKLNIQLKDGKDGTTWGYN